MAITRGPIIISLTLLLTPLSILASPSPQGSYGYVDPNNDNGYGGLPPPPPQPIWNPLDPFSPVLSLPGPVIPVYTPPGHPLPTVTKPHTTVITTVVGGLPSGGGGGGYTFVPPPPPNPTTTLLSTALVTSSVLGVATDPTSLNVCPHSKPIPFLPSPILHPILPTKYKSKYRKSTLTPIPNRSLHSQTQHSASTPQQHIQF
jgi:hypothetical protein